jgi:phospholipase DDHD1
LVLVGLRINRGYKTSAETDDNSGDITHLIFVVHGIAQKLYEKSIIKNRDEYVYIESLAININTKSTLLFQSLRKGFESVKAKFFADNKKKLRCEFIPVDWRSSLTLDDGIVESITPQTIKSIRNKLNSSALDIMYYTSPLFRLEVHILIIRNL